MCVAQLLHLAFRVGARVGLGVYTRVGMNDAIDLGEVGEWVCVGVSVAF
jgi:hypothetical protein